MDHANGRSYWCREVRVEHRLLIEEQLAKSLDVAHGQIR